jgi:hypothetical protein
MALPAIGESPPAGSSEKPAATESRPDGQRPPRDAPRDAEGQSFPGLPEIG